jgi:hypothetical protein
LRRLAVDLADRVSDPAVDGGRVLKLAASEQLVAGDRVLSERDAPGDDRSGAMFNNERDVVQRRGLCASAKGRAELGRRGDDGE